VNRQDTTRHITVLAEGSGGRCNYRGRSEYVRRAVAGQQKWDSVKGRITCDAFLPATICYMSAFGPPIDVCRTRERPVENDEE
jgi:hypothetical protein